MKIRHTAAALTSAAALSVTGIAAATPASAAPPVIAAGNLVNVQVTDVLNGLTVTVSDVNVTVAAAAKIIAQVCGTQIPVAVLATQVIATDGEFLCDATTGTQDVTVTNA